MASAGVDPPTSAGAPLPSSDPPVGAAPAAPPSPPPPDASGMARPPVPTMKASSLLLAFLFSLGLVMIIDASTRTEVATLLGYVLNPVIGFGHQYVLLTMFCAALIEMALTALAYNWATDWIKTSRIQSWSAAFRKVQMEALRSGKKDRMEALKPHQAEITRLSGELSISQLKGMAVTWFLVIAIYTWVGLFIGASTVAQQTVNFGAAGAPALVDIDSHFYLGPFPIPYWIVLFSLYTFPLSYILRRSLKHYSLRRWELAHPPPPPTAPAA